MSEPKRPPFSCPRCQKPPVKHVSPDVLFACRASGVSSSVNGYPELIGASFGRGRGGRGVVLVWVRVELGSMKCSKTLRRYCSGQNNYQHYGPRFPVQLVYRVLQKALAMILAIISASALLAKLLPRLRSSARSTCPR